MENTTVNWLRCNKCYWSIEKTARTLFLTQCQHVFCSKCSVDAEKECPECRTLDVRTVQLVKPLPDQLGHYFGGVGGPLQQCLDASRFQRTQMSIAMRRFDEIQDRYEDMKKTYYQSAREMQSLVAAYTQLKEKNAKTANEIAQLRSMMAQPVKPKTGTSFVRAADDNCAQQKRRTMDYVTMSHSKNLSDVRSSIQSLSSSRTSLAPVTSQSTRYPTQQHVTHNAHQNRPNPNGAPDYRLGQAGNSQYPKRVISSYVLPSPTPDARHLGAAWIARNRGLDSSRNSSDLTSSAGTIRKRPTDIHNYV